MRPSREGFLLIRDALHLMLRLMVAAARFYAAVGYKGDIEVGLTLQNMRNQRMVFVPVGRGDVLHEDDFRGYENQLSGRQVTASETLQHDVVQVLDSVISQVCWPFWQSAEAFPAEQLRQTIERIVREMGHL